MFLSWLKFFKPYGSFNFFVFHKSNALIKAFCLKVISKLVVISFIDVMGPCCTNHTDFHIKSFLVLFYLKVPQIWIPWHNTSIKTKLQFILNLLKKNRSKYGLRVVDNKQSNSKVTIPNELPYMEKVNNFRWLATCWNSLNIKMQMLKKYLILPKPHWILTLPGL
jgi:hypothetical protein